MRGFLVCCLWVVGLVAQEPAYGRVLPGCRGRIPTTQLIDAIWIDGCTVGVHKGEVEVKQAACACVAGHAQILAANDVYRAGLRPLGDGGRDRGQVAVVGVVGYAVDVVLDEDSVALAGRAVAAGFAVGCSEDREGAPATDVVVVAVDEVDTAMLPATAVIVPA